MALSQQLLSYLAQSFAPEEVLTDPGECWVYGYDNSRVQARPEAVVFPKTHEQVVSLVKACNNFKIPLTARGRGTNTTGSSIPLYGGIVVSTERMDKILKIDPANCVCSVQAGVLNKTVQTEVAAFGLMWAPDPSSGAYASVGGNIAVNAAGPRAVKYGSVRENTLGLRIVTGAGDDFYTGTYTTKGAVGYDLTRLMIGSEGTLAIITEASLKLIPFSSKKISFQASYNSIHASTQAVIRVMQQAYIPCALELMDATAIQLVREYASIHFLPSTQAVLLVEIDGEDSYLNESARAVQKALTVSGLLDIRSAKTEAEKTLIWSARKALSPALRKIAPSKINEDIVVPIAELGIFIDHTQKLSKKYKIKIVNFGHAGNGNLHVNLLFNAEAREEKHRAEACLNELFDLVLTLKGTLSGEHGIGLLKRPFIIREIDPSALELMKKIKNQFDPRGILNMGKVL